LAISPRIDKEWPMNATGSNDQAPAMPPPKVPDADMENEETDHNDDGKEQGQQGDAA
jgi:hypothetical protein